MSLKFYSDGRLVFKHVQAAKWRKSIGSMVFSVQGPTCCSVSGGLFTISEWPEGILALTVTHVTLTEHVRWGGGGGGYPHRKERIAGALIFLFPRSADRGESLRWYVASKCKWYGLAYFLTNQAEKGERSVFKPPSPDSSCQSMGRMASVVS